MPNKSWKITNSTQKKNLIVIDASVDADDTKKFYYEQDISILNSSSTSAFVKPGNFFTVPVPDAKKDSSGVDLPYTFILAEAETLAPILLVNFKNDLSDLVDTAVSDTDVANIQQAFDFNKNITAFPGSDLAKNFTTLDLTDDSAVVAYFNGTKDYKNVSLENLLLVRSYFKALPYGWAGGKDITIHLYSGSYEDDTPTERPIGKINISNDWTIPLSTTVSKDFKVEMKLKQESKAKELVFRDGVFWDTIDTDFPKISLAGSFVMLSQLTGESADDVVVTYLVGSINGNDVFGVESLAPDHDDSESGFYDLFHVHNFKDGIDLAMYFIGIALGIELFIKIGHFVHWYKNRGKKTVDQNEREAQTEALKEYIRQNNEIIAGRVNPLVKISQITDLPANQEMARQKQLDFSTRQSKAAVQDIINAQSAQLKAIGNKHSTTETQRALDRIDEVQQRIDGNSLAEFRGNFEGTLGLINQNTEAIRYARDHANLQDGEQRLKDYNDALDAYNRATELREGIDAEINRMVNGEDERGEIVPEEG